MIGFHADDFFLLFYFLRRDVRLIANHIERVIGRNVELFADLCVTKGVRLVCELYQGSALTVSKRRALPAVDQPYMIDFFQQAEVFK